MSKFVEVNEKSQQIKNLAEAFLTLLDTEECLALFDDLFTVREIEDISARLEVARLLKAGVNYTDIAAATGASTATISRVSKCLSGDRGGYRAVLERIEEDVDAWEVLDLESLDEDEIRMLRIMVKAMKKKNART